MLPLRLVLHDAVHHTAPCVPHNIFEYLFLYNEKMLNNLFMTNSPAPIPEITYAYKTFIISSMSINVHFNFETGEIKIDQFEKYLPPKLTMRVPCRTKKANIKTGVKSIEAIFVGFKKENDKYVLFINPLMESKLKRMQEIIDAENNETIFLQSMGDPLLRDISCWSFIPFSIHIYSHDVQSDEPANLSLRMIKPTCAYNGVVPFSIVEKMTPEAIMYFMSQKYARIESGCTFHKGDKKYYVKFLLN